MSLFPSNMIASFVSLNAIQIISVGIILGIFIMQSASKSHIKQLKNIFDTLYNAILAFIRFVVTLTPF
ncbi:MAG: cation:dicarboxylase symporter family transporter [Candidatus Peribacteria bacterium]|nr:MAG: cation:dicarboxylase symporter family transporter [Candidatus Peribacteria bacterium]